MISFYNNFTHCKIYVNSTIQFFFLINFLFDGELLEKDYLLITCIYELFPKF